MRNVLTSLAVCMLCSGISSTFAYGQRGTGQSAGVARQPAQPELVTRSGKVLATESGRCRLTTGRALVGTHVRIETAEGKELNIHLGPETAVRDAASRLIAGKNVTAKAFRTASKCRTNEYVAVSLAVGDETIQLRDENLRPVWAGAGGFGRGLGRSQGSGWGPGRRSGFTPNAGYCPAWGGPPEGRGGLGRGGRGRGYGAGRGRGWGAQG